LSPAGDWASLKAAVENGADSVYFGIKGMNMRHMASNFDSLQLKKVMSYLHGNKRKGYLALNVVMMDKDILQVKKILQRAKFAKVDAVILWDMAVFSLAKKLKIPIHISTQASVANIEAVTSYAKMGAKRVILARECTLDDLKHMTRLMKTRKIKCKIETFIHGAMCVSVSGRCFLSHNAFGKSANKGECIQPCRREFKIIDSDNESEYILGKDYLLSPKDLCAIDFIDELVKTGVDSFKIEGRMRSPDYVKVVTSVYRRAIDAFFEKKLNKSLKKSLKEELSTVYNRGFSSGFYFGKPKNAISRELEHKYEKVFLGEVVRFFKKINVAEVKLRTGDLRVGNEVLFIGNHTPAYKSKITEIQKDHISLKSAKKGEIIGIKLPFIVKPKDKVFLWRKKS